MNYARNKYVPPKVEIICLAPCEAVAAWDWKFGSTWTGEKYFNVPSTLASGIAMGGGFNSEDFLAEDGFVIK